MNTKELQLAKRLAVRWLARRAFFKAELEDKLRKKDISAEIVEEVVLFCRKIGALDDEKLQEKIIEKELRKGKGKAYALAKCKRWVDQGVITPSLDNVEALEKEAIQKVLEKKKVSLSSLDYKEKTKLFRFFLQRGFEARTIQQVLFERP